MWPLALNLEIHEGCENIKLETPLSEKIGPTKWAFNSPNLYTVDKDLQEFFSKLLSTPSPNVFARCGRADPADFSALKVHGSCI